MLGTGSLPLHAMSNFAPLLTCYAGSAVAVMHQTLSHRRDLLCMRSKLCEDEGKLKTSRNQKQTSQVAEEVERLYGLCQALCRGRQVQ